MYPLDISGITGESVKKFMFNENANEQTMSQLVSEIPPQFEVVFYDKDFPSPSDPGACVAFRQIDGQYMIQRSNHGWQKKREAIAVESLVSYLSKCSKYRPFCSNRCRLIDLGSWFSEDHAIPGDPLPEDETDDSTSRNQP